MNRTTMLFNYVSREGRAGGWSESWYLDGQPAEVLRKQTGAAILRAGLLPPTIKILGFRVAINVNDPTLPSRSITTDADIRGALPHSNQDVPQMALLCKCLAPSGLAVRSFTLRGLPDIDAFQGDFQDNEDITPAFNAYVRFLADNGFCFRSGNPANPKAGLVSVNNVGVFVLANGITFNQGDALKMFRVRDTSGAPVKGGFFVQTKVDDRHGTLANWTGQIVSASGSVSKVTTPTFPGVTATNTNISRLTVRKVGRPTVVYRGRQRTRR